MSTFLYKFVSYTVSGTKKIPNTLQSQYIFSVYIENILFILFIVYSVDLFYSVQPYSV